MKTAAMVSPVNLTFSLHSSHIPMPITSTPFRKAAPWPVSSK